jgi:hypothetical protein
MMMISFRRDAQGRELFFPWRKFGRGRIVPSAECGAWVRRYLRAYQVCAIVSFILLTLLRRTDEGMMLLVALLIVAVIAVMPLWLHVRRWKQL